MKLYGNQAKWKTALSPWAWQNDFIFILFVVAIAGLWTLGGNS